MKSKKATTTNQKRGKVTSIQKPIRQDHRTQFIVEFREGIALPYNQDAAKYIREYNVGPWDQLSKKHHGLTIAPLYTSLKPEVLIKLIGKAKEMDPTYKGGNFFQLFTVTCPIESTPKEVLADLSMWHNIARIKQTVKYLHPTVSYADEVRSVDQDYLNAAPTGIGAKTVWDNTLILGSDGAGIKFCDVEKGWTAAHLDLGTVNCLAGTIDNNGRDEGTSVLGIVGAADNGGNCIGIAPASTLNAIAYYDAPVPTGELSLENAILYTLTHLGFGDVLLIEAQKQFVDSGNTYDGCMIPVEVDLAVFNAIRLASALGIVVVEPGGNGNNSTLGVDFDSIRQAGNLILKPGESEYLGDSGAIIVSASHSELSSILTTHEKMPWAPSGQRIDCYAWGENITTLSSDASGADNLYTDTFDGTSAAAAIIAGAILNIQGMALQSQGFRFSPLQIRTMLKNSAYGTPLSIDDGGGSQFPLPIYMPDLNIIATSVLNTLPDLYLRDHIGDDGSPHSGAISWSPDVINRTSAVASPDTPQSLFGGANLANRESDSLSENATYNTTNYLYFRALNQGGALPTNAKVTAFYADPATLLTPSMLNLIGEIDFPIPIPFSDIIDNLTVSNVLPWIPTSPAGHYCFVAVISCEEDPSIDPKTIPDWDWDKYSKYIRENNNVTWKNFDIVEMKKKSSSSEQPVGEPEDPQVPEPDPIQEQDQLPDTEPEQPEHGNEGGDPPSNQNLPKDGWLGLGFISPGIPDRNQKMSLEVISRLPRGVKVLLQTPLSWKKMVYRGSPYVLHNKKKRLAFAPVNPLGNTRLNDIDFKANSKTKLRLFVHVPEKMKTRSYIIAVRQLLDDKEVGRFTWKLVPPKKREKVVPKKPNKKRR
ncbi:MAG: S8 family serine peptidase [Tenuifilaceae bacterium]